MNTVETLGTWSRLQVTCLHLTRLVLAPPNNRLVLAPPNCSLDLVQTSSHVLKLVTRLVLAPPNEPAVLAPPNYIVTVCQSRLGPDFKSRA